MNCKNCGEISSGNFCSQCGQKLNVKRISLSSLFNDLVESVFQVNSGLFFTLKELFVRPGKSIQEFLNGKRKNHFKPIAYVLLFSTIYFIVSKITNQNTWMDDAIFGFTKGAYDQGEQLELSKMMTWFISNFAYTSLLLVPVFSLASYLCFSKFEPNYFEHVVLNSYITGQQAIFYILFCLLRSVIDSELMEMIPFLITIAYSFFVFFQFFNKGNRILNILRSLLTYVLYLIFSLGILIIIMAIQEVN